MHLSRRATGTRTSATLAALQLAGRLREEGRDIVSLGIGEPDFGPSARVKAAGIAAISEGRTGYTATAGLSALRSALAERAGAALGAKLDAAEIIVAAGTKPLLHAALLSLCDPDDEVILPAPYWVSYPPLIDAANARAVIVGATPEEGFVLSPDALREAITSRTRVLLLNSPNNPTGAVYESRALHALADVLRDHPQVAVITDEIYEHLCYPPLRHRSLRSVAPDLGERILIISGFSKGYGMIGWRLGFAIGPSALVRAMDGQIGHLVGAPSTIAQHAALTALADPPSGVDEHRSRYAKRRDRAVDALRAIPGLRFTTPGGAFFVLIDCRALLGKPHSSGMSIHDDEAFVAAALEHAGLVLTPGSAFGAAGFVRISYSVESDVLDEGLARLQRFCAGFRG